jgi:hypothetical protein
VTRIHGPALVLLALTMPLAAVDWPVEKKIVTATFGESREDHFHAGIDIGGGEQEVRPIMDGELVFRYDEGSDYTSLPRGVGGFVALRHTDKYVSIYCHLKDGSVPTERTRFPASQPLGIMGDTGFSEGRHLHLEVFDIQEAAFLNPLSLLPPLADHQAPVIKRVLLKTGETLTPLVSGATISPGPREILAEIYDPREDVRFLWPMAPYSIRLALNGKEASRIVFDSIQVRDGRMVIGGTHVGVSDVFAADRLIRCGTVELRGGESHLLLAARDFAGNETVKEIFFTISE